MLKQPSARGDTIISVLISVVIIGSVLGITYYVANSSLQLGRASQERSYAINVVSTQIERLKALIDTHPNEIFDNQTGIIWRDTSSQALPVPGFGKFFCLGHDTTVRGRAKIDIIEDNTPSIYNLPVPSDIPTDCQDAGKLDFPVPDAKPRLTVRYQRQALSCGTMYVGCNDRDRFEIKITWIMIGSDRRDEITALLPLASLKLNK